MVQNVPISITINDSDINDCLKEWLERKAELLRGEITRDEYLEWKINWPESRDNFNRSDRI